MLQITVDMFSGRPNPTWVVDADQARALLQDIAQNQSAIGDVSAGYQGLGYRGVIVEALIDNVASNLNLPAKFRVAHTANAKGLEFADRVFSAMRQAEVWDVCRLAIQELQRLGSREETSEADEAAPPPAPVAPGDALAAGVTCWIELGHFNPGFWNDPAHVGKNNCYNYASNRRTDTFAQPGRATGHQASVMACPDVTTAALSDGLHHRHHCFPIRKSRGG